jgi:hypothetical protein
MKTLVYVVWVLAIVLAPGCGKNPPASSWSIDRSAKADHLKQFISEKEQLARKFAEDARGQLPGEFDRFWRAAGSGDWQSTTNLLDRMGRSLPGGGRGRWWQPVAEVGGAFGVFSSGDKYAIAFGTNIIRSIPDGSIYFGGTDPGRFLVTALIDSHGEGRPFFVLTQNQLADSTYLDYIQSIYGKEIYVPTSGDLQKCFRSYSEDAARRRDSGELKPGENVVVDARGRMQISGQVAVMGINALLARVIFDQNTNRELYIEESYPLEWMYPYAEPHGLIMKINREQVTALPDDLVRRDHEYWTTSIGPMIGGWIKEDTSVKEIATRVEKIYVDGNLDGFTGDPDFIGDEEAEKMFSKARSAIAGIYTWRAQYATDDGEKKRMNQEADFAFRQAWALCPYEPETVRRYVNQLERDNRPLDALLVARTAAKMPATVGPERIQLLDMARQLEQSAK